MQSGFNDEEHHAGQSEPNQVKNTFLELLSLGVIPIVNENDTIATYEIDYLSVFGDNDTLSAVVASLIGADLLILLVKIRRPIY